MIGTLSLSLALIYKPSEKQKSISLDFIFDVTKRSTSMWCDRQAGVWRCDGDGHCDESEMVLSRRPCHAFYSLHLVFEKCRRFAA